MNTLRLGLVILCGLALLPAPPVKGDEYLNPIPAHKEQVREKLNTIFVSIDLKNATIKQAIEALATCSAKADPDHHGITFYVDPRTSEFAKPITLKLENVPVGVALHYVCELSHLTSGIDDRFVDILPPPFGCGGLAEETFHVDPSFFGTAPQAKVGPTPQISP